MQSPQLTPAPRLAAADSHSVVPRQPVLFDPLIEHPARQTSRDEGSLLPRARPLTVYFAGAITPVTSSSPRLPARTRCASTSRRMRSIASR